MNADTRRIHGRFRGLGAAYLILLISLFPAGVAFHRVHKNVIEREQIRFDSAVRSSQRAIETRLRSLLGGLSQIRAPALDSTNSAVAERWQHHFDGLNLEERFPGFAGALYAVKVAPEEKESFEQQMRAGGSPGYVIQTSGTRDELLPIVYQDSTTNGFAPGFDLGTHEAIRNAVTRALITGKAEMTSPLLLPEKNRTAAGFGVVTMVFDTDLAPRGIDERKALYKGCVVTLFRAERFFSDITGDDAILNFTVHDGEEASAATELFAQHLLPQNGKPIEELRAQSSIRASGRSWTLRFETAPAFKRTSERHLPWMVLATSLGISAALFAVALSQARARRKLEQLTEDLRKSQERDRLIERATNDIIWDWDVPNNHLHWNEALQTTLGYAANKIEPTIEWWQEKVHPDDKDRIVGGLKSALETGGGFWADEYRFQRGDGTYAAIIDRGYIIHEEGRAVRMIGSMIDITDRKRAEEARWQSEQKLRLHAQQTPLAVIEWDLNFRVTSWNPAAEKIFGYSASEATGQHGTMIIPDIARDHVDQIWSNLVAQRGGRRSTNENKAKDGRIIICDWYNTPLINAEGNVIGVASLAMEVTESKRMSEALAAEKERLAVTLRSIGEGVIATDIHEKVILMNKVAERLTSCRQIDSIGKPVQEIFRIVHSKNRDPYENPVTQVLRAAGVIEMTGRSAVLMHHGGECTINFSCSPIRNDQSEVVGTVLVFRDVTDELRATEELLRASKLESLGVLAGGIAHDFNNILTVVVGNLSFAKLYANTLDRVFPRLVEAEKAAIRARDLTHQLLTFAKGGSPIKQTASIVELIKENVGFAMHGSNVRCDIALPNDLWPVEVDQGQVGQVIENLILNAVQAMPQGGVIYVKGDNEVLSRDAIGNLQAGKFVHVSVRDQGTGIRPEHLSKIFDPYFTTKSTGSGLGLASSYSIVRNHGGIITVESTMGVGSIFHIYLPASDNPIEFESEAAAELVGGHGRVLVMDDDDRIRDLAASMLQTLGYQADVACSGEEAIQKCNAARDAGHPFRVVIMDLTIPGGMGGKEAVRIVHKSDPKLKAIVSSGYSNDPVMANYRDYGFHGVLAKPYKMEDLARELRRMTDER